MEKVTLILMSSGETFSKEDLEAMLVVLREGKTVDGRIKNSSTFFTVIPTEGTIKVLEEKLKLIK